MTPVSRALTGAHLTFHLAELIADLRAEDHYAQTGRIGRTLVKEGALRITLTVLARDAEVGTHRAVSPMTLHVLEGRLRYRVGEEEHELHRGEFLFFGPGHAKDIRALADTALLLTITGAEAEGGP